MIDPPRLRRGGRIMARSVDMYMDIDSVIRAGITADPEVPRTVLNSKEQLLLKYYDLLTDVIPNLHDQLLSLDGFVVIASRELPHHLIKTTSLAAGLRLIQQVPSFAQSAWTGTIWRSEQASELGPR